MYKNQKGFIQLLAVVLILLGVGTGVYLVRQTTDLTSEAKGNTIQIIDSAGKPITTTLTAEVNVKLKAPWPPVSPTPLPTPTPYTSNTCPTPPSCEGNLIIGDPADLSQCPTYQCASSTAVAQKPKTSPSPLFGVSVVMAEDPNFTQNVMTIPYYKSPLITKYVFSGKPGKKTLYAKFEKQTASAKKTASVKARPFPAVVNLTGKQSPTPTPICKEGVNSFSVGKPCEGGNFTGAAYECYDGLKGTLGGETSCKPSETWSKYAEEACIGRSSCPPEKIICGGKLGKICPAGYVCKRDTRIRDGEGYCIKESRVCVQVITRACPPEISAYNSPECKDFPTPCDVPDGWRVVRNESAPQ